MKVAVITEGSSHIGFGHITRCTSLYEAFEEKKISPIMIVNGDESISPLTKGIRSEVFNWLADKERLFDMIKAADIAVVDSYLADIDFYDRVSKTVNVPLYIDDTMRINYPDGIVLNGSIYAEKLDYPKKKGKIHLLGSKYIPLRKEFWNILQKDTRDSIRSVLITFGGDDIRNLTPEILGTVKKNFPGYEKKVIIGSGYKNITRIEALKDEKTELVYSPDATGMIKAMIESDVAISAAGQTLYELARIGIPTIAIAVADNQMNNVKGWQQAGFIEFAGCWNDKDISRKVKESLQRLKNVTPRKDKSIIGRRWIDGLGARRVASISLSQCLRSRIILRKAGQRDALRLYELANDPEVRQNSFNSQPIEFDTHQKWLTNTLQNDGCLLLIAEIQASFAGQVRFDINDNEAVISISIARKYRGVGAGVVLIDHAVEILKNNHQHIRCIKSKIKSGNTRSVSLFESAGFHFLRQLATDDGQQVLEYIYELN